MIVLILIELIVIFLGVVTVPWVLLNSLIYEESDKLSILYEEFYQDSQGNTSFGAMPGGVMESTIPICIW
jgi:hypothetical protein